MLIKHFIEKYTQGPERAGIVTGIDKEAIQRLCDYEWRGNVRELENVIERAIILAKGSIITVSDLPSQIRNPKAGTLQLDGIPDGVGLSETLAAVEKRMILRAMKMSGNVQTTAAKILGIGKSGLNQKLKKFNLDKELKLDNK